ncbi:MULTISPECIES: GNAT family N-acetyltransferase [unclassified Streptococcus]|uniref:GNAT family N-acetyltransferase n=1 Tax=unclassified Streptococcus TaxID=2608887 RepID=UPI0011B61DB5|nr:MULTISPECIES: GNAT family N-acetyltransferase [unclassified Streptococcus]TWS94882.1 GNAT family N-acetyltransferase [Streptococcus sp. sy018]TWT16224.1 GNAT family N-acetyltransferase [Streptococcus sp. sy010]
MQIRQVRLDDLERLMFLERENFLPDEAITETAMSEQIKTISDSFLVAEIDNQVVGYITAHARQDKYLKDDVFMGAVPNQVDGGYFIISALSVAKSHQGQGIGSSLLATMKDLAVAQDRQGLSLTCHDHLISYYVMNGFVDEGESNTSNLGGYQWYNLVWYAPA